MSQWQPKRIRPRHLTVIELHFRGHTNQEICDMTGYVPSVVSQIVTSPLAIELMDQMKDRVFDTITDVQTTAQSFAPQAMENLMSLAMNAKNESVRKTANTDILAICGHTPINRTVIEDARAPKLPHDGLTEDEIRAQLLRDAGQPLAPTNGPPADSNTVH